MAYILNKPYDPSTFPGPTIRRPPYYELGPSVRIPNAPDFPRAFDSPWHADVSGMQGLEGWEWLKGFWPGNWFKKGSVTYEGGYGPEAPEGWEQGIKTSSSSGGWLNNVFSFFKGSFFGGSKGYKTLTTKDGRTITGHDFYWDSVAKTWYYNDAKGMVSIGGSDLIATATNPTTIGQGNLSKLFGAIGGALKDLFSKATSGGGTEPGPGGGTEPGGGGTGTNGKKQTIAGLDLNILLVIGALAIGGLFIVMSRPTTSGQPQIIMPEMFRPRRTYARRRAAPVRRTTVRKRATSRRRR